MLVPNADDDDEPGQFRDGMKQGTGICAVFLLLTTVLRAVPSETPCATVEPTAHACAILWQGVTAKRGRTRTKAVRALATLSAASWASGWAERALSDKDVEVRYAAASALAKIGRGPSVPLLVAALKDHEPRVALAAAEALYMLGDPAAFEVFRTILNGKQPAVDGFVKEHMKTVKDPKVLAWMSVEQGAAFVPYAGFAVWFLEAFLKHPETAARADAARKLSQDGAPESTEALIQGTCDRTWQVRAVAATALADRNDPTLLVRVIPLLTDRSDSVRFAAAAAVLRLSGQGPGRDRAIRSVNAGQPNLPD